MAYNPEDAWRAFCSAEPHFQKSIFISLFLAANLFFCHLDDHHRQKNKSVKE